MSLAGKKAVVFGGTSGIGLAACHKLVIAGAEVVAASRDPEKAGRGEIPAGVRLVKCDVRDEEGLAAALAAEAPYDILISSATGGERAVGPFMTMDMAGFKASFDKLCAPCPGYPALPCPALPCPAHRWLCRFVSPLATF
jgi:NAD(P)-dependent dehydrogenase (short-subunit alcohol dehydrogenase family)